MPTKSILYDSIAGFGLCHNSAQPRLSIGGLSLNMPKVDTRLAYTRWLCVAARSQAKHQHLQLGILVATVPRRRAVVKINVLLMLSDMKFSFSFSGTSYIKFVVSFSRSG